MTSVRWQCHNHHPPPQNTCLTTTHPWEYLCGSQRVQQRSSSIPVVGAKTPKIDAVKSQMNTFHFARFAPSPRWHSLVPRETPPQPEVSPAERRSIVRAQLLKPCRTHPIGRFFLASPRIQRVSHSWVVRRNWEQVRETRTHRHKGCESYKPLHGLNREACPQAATGASAEGLATNWPKRPPVPQCFVCLTPSPKHRQLLVHALLCGRAGLYWHLLSLADSRLNSAGLEDDTQFWAFQAMP